MNMFNLFPISLLIIALGGAVYIISGHLSKLDENIEEDESIFGVRNWFVKQINQLPIEQAKIQSLSMAQKMLHRLRIVLLKADNHLMDLIGKISEKDRILNGNGENKTIDLRKEKKNSDFWRDFSKEGGETQIPLPENPPEIKIELVSKPTIDRKVEKFFDIKPAKKISRVKKSVR